ncbi:transcriptional regulator domain-containing protein [Sphingopyxis granuli]|uniref:transcriptional regulator domain-containing protein n=1 Tax=Sphingopyxis granuli TaxID=267128 RepID=UPI00301CEF1F
MDQAVDWRSPYFPRIFETYDRADFAQEFLRRSPAYRGAYAAAIAARGAERIRQFRRLASRWGLVFRLRS